MLSFALPWVAGAGLLLGLVPLALHLLVRRPPARAPLPTARFLTPDPRTRVALDRRPRDLLLLLMRMSFLLLLGMGLAGPRWMAERSGTTTLVLLDRTPGMAPVWEEAQAAARAFLEGVQGPVVVLAVGAEVQEVPVAAFLEGEDVSPPGSGRTDGYLGIFRQLRRRLEAEHGLDSVEVVLVTRPRREAWTPGLGGVRSLLYPGAVHLVEVSGTRDAEPRGSRGGGGSVPARVLRPDGAPRGFVEAALEALGRVVADTPSGPGGAESAGGRLVVVPAQGSMGAGLDGVSRGDTLIVEAGSAGLGGGPPLWESDDAAAPAPGAVPLLAAGTPVPGALLLGGAPARGVRIPLTGEDGRPVAAAAAVGGGCLVVTGFRLEEGDLPRQPTYPRVLEELARACLPPPTGSGPLDRGALDLLRGEGRPARVALEGLSTSAGVDLSRWFLLTALLLAILEAVMGYRKP